MNKYILGILKKMAKCSDIRQTEAWTESKKEMISILTKKIQKIKVDQHFNDVDVNHFHMGIHCLVSWFSTLTFQKNIFLDKSNWFCYLLLEWSKKQMQSICHQLVWPNPSSHLLNGSCFLSITFIKKWISRNGCSGIHPWFAR